MSAAISPRDRDRLALALDLPLPEAEALYERVSPYFAFAKVGLGLFVANGPAVVEPFLRLGAKVFLDLKLHDIPNTVEAAARQAGGLGPSLLTVHAHGGSAMLRAAKAGAAEGAVKNGFAAPKILAVTVLTSLADSDLAAMGHNVSALQLAHRLAQVAVDCGMDGLVCSPHEVARLRRAFGPKLFLCTPGIRTTERSRGDQSRVATPEEAIRSGADLLVVGRPVYAATDPLEAARSISVAVSAAT